MYESLHHAHGSAKSAAVYTDNYGEAGAVDRLSPSLTCPAPQRPQQHLLGYRGPPPNSDVNAVVVGDELRAAFASCTQAGAPSSRRTTPQTRTASSVPVRELARSWASLWPLLKHYG